jgi:glycosyltransferase involved in cell wall biosynthesis
MIIIEASHVNFGGSYSLLVELLKYLSKREIQNNVYIAHKKVIEQLKLCNFTCSTLILTNTLATVARYARKRKNIIFFINLPPFVKNKKSVVYFHNELILTENQFKIENLKLFIYHNWLKFFIHKVDAIACQSDNILDGLSKIGADTILKLPFFEEFEPNSSIQKKYTFCYICSGAPHKNLYRLFEALKLVIKKYDIILAVTIEDSEANKFLLNSIDDINKTAGKSVIENRGLVSKKEVIEIYQSSEALVFPSLKESLGLPLIEANMCGIQVLSSDLTYSHEILNSPIVFNPYDSNAIAEKMELFLEGKYINVKQRLKIKNKIEELINIVL